MSINELKAVYVGKELPSINDDILSEADLFAKEHNCSPDEALMFILDMMIEHPFEDENND